MAWTQPQQTLELDAGDLGCLWVEMVAEIDQGGRFTHLRGRGQHRERQREPTAGAPADELDHLTALQAAGEQSVGGGDASGEVALDRFDRPARLLAGKERTGADEMMAQQLSDAWIDGRRKLSRWGVG